MSSLPNLFRFVRELTRFLTRPRTSSFFLLGIFFIGASFHLSAQTITWTDRFQQGVAPTEQQCQKWGAFLKDLGGKQFASVTMSGEFDPKGRTITDPAAATELASLLHLKQEGVVVSGNHTWRVTHCDFSACADGRSISLSVDGAATCACSDTYTLRPQSKNADWGGINTGTSCNAKSQFMSLEFHSGVSIVPQGPTFICEGSSVELKAESTVCSPVQSYVWKNNETGESVGTGPSIVVNKAGLYSVTVFGAGDCSATSAATRVGLTDVTVDAGPDVTYCQDPIQLNATGQSVGGTGSTMVNKVCLFDAFGLFGGGCTFPSYDICLDGTVNIINATYTQTVSFSNPIELRYKLYYSSKAVSTFRFKLNGKEIGSYIETNTAGLCTKIGEGGAPFTFAFTADKFKEHWLEGSNALTVEVSSSGRGVDMAGAAVDVVTSDESYSWSPAAGLNVTTIKNPTASPTEATTYTVTYTDPSGCTATDYVEVAVCAVAPIAVCKEVTVPVDVNSCTADVDPSVFNAGSTSPSGGTLSYAASPAGPYPVGVTAVVLTVSDASGSSTCSTNITVIDPTLPQIETLVDRIEENDDGECFATIQLEQPEASDNCQVKSVSRNYESDVFPVGETIVEWTVTDIHDNKATATQSVHVVNATPVIESVVATPASVIARDPVSLTVHYIDNNVKDAIIDWGDGSALETVIEPADNFEVSHTFLKSGTYAVYITLTDKCGKSTYSYTTIVVSNGRSGIVRGGGWFHSPRGAYAENPNASGKATFAFEASNLTRNQVPDGNIVFNFHEANLKFRSTQIEWVRIGDETASISAVGRLNGDQNYRILISAALDGQENPKKNKESKIGIKIWDPMGNGIYDTQGPDEAVASIPVTGGTIQIKEQRPNFNEKYESRVATSFGEETSSVYPNPFTDWVDVEFSSSSRENVAIQVMDLSGKVIFNEVFPVSEDGKYPLDIQEREKGEPGVYMLVIKQGKRVEVLRLVRN